jgi:hypothetical protein
MDDTENEGMMYEEDEYEDGAMEEGMLDKLFMTSGLNPQAKGWWKANKEEALALKADPDRLPAAVDKFIKKFETEMRGKYPKGGTEYRSDKNEIRRIITGKDPGGQFYATRESLQTELDEAYTTIKTLRQDLNEINLLNAKLLYTNKIFKSKNLNENQKVKVLSSFDKATTVGEVKLVFETLNEGLKVKATKLNENLGSASKVLSAPKKQPIVESNDMVARFQKLAGII